MGFQVVVFHSTQHAIRGEKVLLRAGIKVTTIPVPRQISSDCGIALKFDDQDLDKVVQVLEQAKVDVAGIHKI